MNQDPRSPASGPRIIVAAALLALLTMLGHAAPALAHAKVFDSSPSDGAVLDAPPDRVVISFANKPVTLAGDPVQVFGPTGERVDAGTVDVLHGGRAVAIDLQDASALPSGHYHVAYRVMSSDTHLVTGRLGFRAGAAESSDADGAELALTEPMISAGARPLVPEAPADWWPKALAAAIAVSLALAARRSTRRPGSPAS